MTYMNASRQVPPGERSGSDDPPADPGDPIALIEQAEPSQVREVRAAMCAGMHGMLRIRAAHMIGCSVATAPAASTAPPARGAVARPAAAAAVITALGPALEATSLLVSAQGDERVLDDRDRVPRIGRRVIRP